ncbi:hypothetical protein [Aeromicrobium sp.]
MKLPGASSIAELEPARVTQLRRFVPFSRL